MGAVVSSPSLAASVFIGFFILLAGVIRPVRESTVVVERGFVFDAVKSLSSVGSLRGDGQGSFLGTSGFLPTGVPDYSWSAYGGSAAYYGFYSPLGVMRASLSSYAYKVRSGDTLSQIAEDFGVSSEALRRANPEAVRILRVGQEIIIPRGSSGSLSAMSDSSLTSSDAEIEYLRSEELPNKDGDFVLPAKGWNWGQLHGDNAVDIANACGARIVAAADGVVIEESSLGFWNRGYGNFLLIEHDNGTRTRYAHTLRNLVSIGSRVRQGDEIALMGNTGDTTGPSGCHLHFEVLNARNPFSK